MTLKLGLEQISFKHKSLLPLEVYGLIESAHAFYVANQRLPSMFAMTLSEVIHKSTHLRVSVDLVPNEIGASITITNPGKHAPTGEMGKKGDMDPRWLKTLTGRVDLEAVKVYGDFTSIAANMTIGEGSFSIQTPEEVTAMVLHEIGHAFDNMVTLGDYVWLNYYLQEGVEVMLGNKKSQYDVMSVNDLMAHVDRETAKTLRTDPSAENVKRAVLIYFMDPRRSHFHSVAKRGSLKRDEQLADLFVSRLGFGGPHASGLVKMKGRRTIGLPERIARFVAGVGITTAWLSMGQPLLAAAGVIFIFSAFVRNEVADARSDDQYNRIRKMRNDAVAYLSYVKQTPDVKEQLRHIKAFDQALESCKKEARSLGEYVLPNRRGEYHQLKLERTLEDLLNNDLFVSAAALSTVK